MFPKFSSEQWQRVEDLFSTAADLSGDDRRHFLSTIHEGELREFVRKLLDHTGDAGEQIARTIESVAQIASPEESWTGRRFGPYSILREIGRGGMGAVFEAQRDDSEYRLRVALKVALSFRDNAFFKERFRQERQILAALEHPYIARFLDGGTENGLPYFVMEYVEGIPVTDYCDQQKLGLRERIELFRQICAAVDHAHAHLIIHRDLKPGNVLVNSSGTPKLVDFGIAKLRDADSEIGVTTSAMLWTPDYASPEQVRCQSITTRSDTYSLGLILYELLCGAKAQVADTSSPLALDRSICETEPSAPSLRAATSGNKQLAAALTGDLDAIMLRAVQKEPERRFESAAALSEDLRRYLHGEPVLSRRASVAYQIQKLVRRHRLVFASAALVAISLIGGIIATVYQARLASQRFDQVREMSHALMFDIHDAIKPLSGSVPAQRLVVDTALRYLDNLAKTASDPKLQLEIAAGYDRIGSVQGDYVKPSLGKREEALQSFRKALALLQALPSSSLDAEAKTLLAGVHIRIGNHLLDGSAAAEGKQHIEKAIEILEPIASKPHPDSTIDRTLAEAYVAFANTSRSGGHSVIERTVRAISILEPIAATAPAKDPIHINLATALSITGGAHFTSHRVAEAVPYFDKAVRSFEKIVEANPNDAQTRRSLMLAHSKLGDAYWGIDGYSLGDRQKALPSFQRMMESAKWIHGRDPQNVSVRMDYAISLMRYGDALDPADPQGVELLSKSRQLIDEILALNPKDARLARQQLDVCLRLAKRYMATRQHGEEAMRTLEHGARTGEIIARADRSNVSIRGWMLRIYHPMLHEFVARNDLPKARQSAERAVDTARQLAVLDSTSPIAIMLVARTYKLASGVLPPHATELRLQSRALWQRLTTLPNVPKDIVEEAARETAQ